jgi:hypothetical protein
MQGKPAAMAHRQAAVASQKDSETEEDSSRIPVLSSWRLRDAAVSLLKERREQYRVGENSQGSLMILTTHFDVEASVGRIARDKSVAVRQAFHGAATAVLEAIQKSAAPEIDFYSDTGTWRHDLPMSLQTNTHENSGIPRTLDGLRAFCFERSYENKEYAKRKGGKTDANYTPPPPRAPKPKPKPVPPAVTKPMAAKPPPPSSTKVTQKTTKTADAVASSTPVPSSAAASAVPKFTRNTPASSAAALDFRFNSSRAILCVAGNLAFEALTPGNSDAPLDVLDVPQNKKKHEGDVPPPVSSSSLSSTDSVNMGAVLIEAQTMGQRTISIVENAVRRAKLRYQYRKDSVRYDRRDDKDFLRVENPFSFHKQQQLKGKIMTHGADKDGDDDEIGHGEDRAIPYQPNSDSITYVWQTLCLPRFLSVLSNGAGHAVYHGTYYVERLLLAGSTLPIVCTQ